MLAEGLGLLPSVLASLAPKPAQLTLLHLGTPLPSRQTALLHTDPEKERDPY